MRRSCVRINLLFFLLFMVALPAAVADRLVLGWVEWVAIESAGFGMEAKLDTGALTSSLHATDIQRFQRDNQEWVRFVVHDGEGDRAKTLERPLVRNVRIKRHGASSQERPVVTLDFCLAGQMHAAQFSLVDRGHFNYPVLLGRRFLAEVAVVDAGAKHLTGAVCTNRARGGSAKPAAADAGRES